MSDRVSDRRRIEVRKHLRIEGQVRGVQRMIDEDRPCEDVLVQVAAARRALQGAALRLVDDHLHTVIGERDSAAIGDEVDRLLRHVAGLVRP